MKDFERSILIGVVFDLSPLHNGSGIRNLDIVKNILVKEILENKRIYVSHPDWQSIPRDQGESTYYVAAYKEPDKFYIDKMLRNVVTMIGECAEDCDKYVFLITDRFQAPINFQYRKGFLANNIHGYKTKMCVFGIGDNYDSLTLKALVEEYESHFTHLPNAEALSEKLVEALGA